MALLASPTVKETQPDPLPPFYSISCRVAVIGAGVSGLLAARELRREGHRVVVYERGNQVGGCWIYTPESESDPLCLDPERPVVHSSMYCSLRTNLPRKLMSFRDYPFVAEAVDWSVDPRAFPGHAEVLSYLKGFARDFAVEEMVRFDTEVVKVELLGGGGGEEHGGRWRVKSRKTTTTKTDGIDWSGGGEESDEVFDAVVVCNGHNTEPRIAECPGIQRWPGKQIHSHNYRTPEPFKDLVVVLIGYGTSSVDISLEIASISKEVHLAIRGPSKIAMHDQRHGFSNIWFHPMIKHAQEDGAIVFEDGTSIYADVILHCTGYKYHFPFLDMDEVVSVDDNRVGPLYKHVFSPILAPWLSFIGLLSKVVSFPLFQLQSKWVAGVLSGRISLPSVKEMMEDVDNFYAQLEAAGVPKRHTHTMLTSMFEYNDWLADQCGLPGMEEWEKMMLFAWYESLITRPGTFRDEWKEDDLASKGYEDFVRSISGQKDDCIC
ncbi:hypothetical protein SAY87_020551 [Trapa incisa]|uniref:Flavin-containing monooxygenase n=1 Tax=Trapa incisa TaxID=236973 RepID=A0AAN7JQX6_9MYRT|nr:hypothetical protein SAY87_020551 [Trapa incisa]